MNKVKQNISLQLKTYSEINNFLKLLKMSIDDELFYNKIEKIFK